MSNLPYRRGLPLHKKKLTIIKEDNKYRVWFCDYGEDGPLRYLLNDGSIKTTEYTGDAAVRCFNSLRNVLRVIKKKYKNVHFFRYDINGRDVIYEYSSD